MAKNQILRNETETYVNRQRIDKRIAIPICALLNTKGGRIVIEFQDKKGNRTTVDFDHERGNILSQIRSELGKGVEQHIRILPFPNKENCDTILIKVFQPPTSLNRHYYCVQNERYYQRIGTTTQPFEIDRKKREDAGILPLVQISKIPNYCKIGNHSKRDVLYYKYMGLEAAIKCIKNSNIQFSKPYTWNDQFEKLFYNKHLLEKVNFGKDLVTFACCMTNKKENEAAWRTYAYNERGLNSRCVQFKINRKKFIEQLLNSIGDKYSLYEGYVSYKSESFIIGLYKGITREGNVRRSLLSQRYLENFDIESFLNLLLLKRDAFMHEQEIRMFIIPNGSAQLRQHKEKYEYPNIDWSEVLEEVLIDSTCSEFEKNLLKESIDNYKYGEKPISDDLKTKLCPKPYDVYAIDKLLQNVKDSSETDL